jgi:UDP-perosamine 4-acetyltransferase
MKKKLVVLGGGGHAGVVIDALKVSGDFVIAGIVDPALEKGAVVYGVKVLGADGELARLFKSGVRYAFIAVGSIGDCAARKKIDRYLTRLGFGLPHVAHPDAVVARGVEIGDGAFIAAGAVINPGVRIGRNAIINTSSSVDHDCVIGDYVHIAPGAVLSGGVKVGDETHVGAGAVVIQRLVIGRKCMIGAGQTIRSGMADRDKSFGAGRAGL